MNKVLPGQRLRMAAADYNAFVDAAQGFRRRAFAQETGESWRDTKPGIVVVRNSSGADRERFAVLTLGGVLIPPDDNEPEFLSRFAFDCMQPGDVNAPHADPEQKFVILQEPLRAGAMGKAMISGLSPVKVDIGHASHEYADFKAGETGYLQSSYTGSARLLYKESGTGVKWALAQFPIYDGPRIRVRNDSGSTIPEGGAMRLQAADNEQPFVFYVRKPDKDHQLHVLPLVGPDLPAGQERWIRLEPVMRFLLDGDAQPGDFLGVKNDAWALEKTKFGFLALAVQNHPSGGKFAYVHFAGLVPLLRAMADEDAGQIDVQLYGGSATFPLNVP